MNWVLQVMEAAALGHTVLLALLLRADEVIERTTSPKPRRRLFGNQ